MRARSRDLRPLITTRHLAVREEAATNHVFIYCHRPLSLRYCGSRLHTYGRRCGVRVTLHQLRHSCATLLLAVEVSILTVQAMLGYPHVDTTLGLARLYDGAVAAHYSGAMGEIEGRADRQRISRCVVDPLIRFDPLPLSKKLRHGHLLTGVGKLAYATQVVRQNVGPGELQLVVAIRAWPVGARALVIPARWWYNTARHSLTTGGIG